MELHEPEFPSPLNPRRQTPVRPREARAKTNVSVSPTQRLLRYRAAEAWRSYKMLHEAREYERLLRETIATREKAVGLRPDRRKQPPPLQPLRYELDGVERQQGRAADGERRRASFEREHGETDHPLIQFHMPDLSFFAPRRVALAVGLLKRFPVPAWFRCERPSQERAC